MCGIAGAYYRNGGNIKELKNIVEEINKVQACRGPDDVGVYEHKKIALGHRRLSILDLSSAGHQPMGRREGRIQIVFNGEIYNFKELREELEARGYAFHTNTDTEVIIALYEEYKESAFQKLRGMFAFALWDDTEQKLLLVKDRYGIKPLYYYEDQEKLIFASTVKAIMKTGVTLHKNEVAIIGFLATGSVPLPMTTWKEIDAVPAGHYLVQKEGESYQIKEYYNSLPFFEKNTEGRYDDHRKEIRRLLEESINLHLISDAPLGVFLSGGVDSSVLALLAAQKKSPLITLSIVFDEEEFSEKKYQEIIVKKIKSDHREIKVTKQDFLDSLDDIFEAMDEPTIDGINTYFIARAAKKAGLKVVLSGLGADEVFAGYPSFKKAHQVRRLHKLPSFLKTILRGASIIDDRYGKLKYLARRDRMGFYWAIRGLFTPDEIANIVGVTIGEIEHAMNDIAGHEKNRWGVLHGIDLLSYSEIKGYLQNQLLKDTDCMSMHHSVEVRVPFLDHPLVEYVSGVSPRDKIAIGTNKPLLVNAVDLLPQEIISRKKMGFTFPFQQWLQEERKAGGDVKNHWSKWWAREVLKRMKI